MENELDNDTPQTRSDLTDAELVVADKAHDDAFRLAFETEDDDGSKRTAAEAPAPAPVAAPAPAPSPSPTPAPAPAPAPAPKPPVEDDPFAGFSPKARELFAKIPELEHDNRSLRGRVPVLQRQVEELMRENAALKTQREAPSSPAAPAAPAERRAIDKVRGELPEVADAIAEEVRAALATRTPAPPPAAPAPAPASADHEQDEATILAAAHPDWQPTMNSTDFKLFVATLPEDRRQTIMSTDKAAPVALAITEFKVHKQAAQARADAATAEAARRNKRAERGVNPASNAAPLTPAEQTEHEAFVAAFNAPG
jgi:hypothetical protein